MQMQSNFGTFRNACRIFLNLKQNQVRKLKEIRRLINLFLNYVDAYYLYLIKRGGKRLDQYFSLVWGKSGTAFSSRVGFVTLHNQINVTHPTVTTQELCQTFINSL